jgi:hypothetical protein
MLFADDDVMARKFVAQLLAGDFLQKVPLMYLLSIWTPAPNYPRRRSRRPTRQATGPAAAWQANRGGDSRPVAVLQPKSP